MPEERVQKNGDAIIAGDFTFELEGNWLQKFFKGFFKKKYEDTACEMMAMHYAFYEELNKVGSVKEEEYVTREATICCSNGTEMVQLDAYEDHGILAENGKPLMTCSDCEVNKNIYSFGTCKCGNIYSEKLPHPSEEGEPDEHGKVRYKCIPVLCGNWKQVTGNLLIAEGENFVEALRSGAFLTCIYEGKITVIGIPEKEAEERKKIQISSWLIAYEGEPTRTGGVEIDIRTEEREKLKENNIKRDGISNVDWYSYEEYTTEDGKLTINKYAVEQYKNIGGKVSEQPDVNGAFVNEKGRYWVAVGPEILSPGYNEQPVEEQTISDNQFKYGTEIDVVLQNSKDKSEVYIECIIGDVKAHTYPNGVFQTGDAYPNCSSKDDGSKHRNGSYIEFINEPKFEDNYINGNMSDYVVIDIIVYGRNVGCCEKKDCEYGDDRNSSYNSAGWCLKL